MSTFPINFHSLHFAEGIRTAVARGIESVGEAVRRIRDNKPQVTISRREPAAPIQSQAGQTLSNIDVEALRAASYGELLKYLETGKPSTSGKLHKHVRAVEAQAARNR